MDYTVTRAITLVKTLKARYQREINELIVATPKRGERLVAYPQIKPEDFDNAEKEKYQSVMSLFNQALKIKNAIDKSNSTTMITIGGIEMTVQEAIVFKNDFLSLKETLLRKLKLCKSQADAYYKKACEDNEALIDKKSSESISGAGADKAKALQTAREDVEKTFGVEMIDPIKISETITKLEKEIEDFRTNIDYALSEINANTVITIED